MIDLTQAYEALLAAASSVGAEITSPWFYAQLGMILAALGIGLGGGALIKARVDMTTLTMGWPAPLRMFLRVVIDSAWTAIFALVVIAVRLAMLQMTWPSRSYLIGVSSKLALAWLMIRLVTSILRNPFLIRVVSLSAWCVAALSIIGQLFPVLDALDSVAIVIGELRLSPFLILKLGVLLAIALWLASIASNFFEGRINQSRDLTPSIQVLLIKLMRIGLMAAAIALTMSAVGINLQALAVFSGAVGVGIGFGLQKIFANFISGVILLVDKSVKPGDLVTIGDNSGRISAMNTRYISVAAGDGREFLIPNEDLITQKVVNWTYTDKNTLVKVAFATNYDADPRTVCRLAIDVAAAVPRASKAKSPGCILTEFTETGMKFALTFWIGEPDGMDGVKSEAMLGLWDAFKREGIGVPYPVREIRVRNGALPAETIVEVPQ
ncbi:mechanosensitive ion channel family protein [Rhodopseudomonas pseudopalustris]|uniref:Mechanosensitive ion channel n=1 Tax=Rhodopseudomonas pseudopalustris TaxID=1513892 RepID=A0A1H8MGU2_9BRAD|nr:mechanosensitive ion channel domain-containing protein [Rhodopseudomonas pseudopalustris]MBB1090173.1 mechanosensitive ion channel [Rhodopseudomonas palustris]SEO16547.1 Mechanosensitive ion channel [Rhodopseudomonas pseudopalustris]